jgi:N-acyl-D-amino-acid deacylase
MGKPKPILLALILAACCAAFAQSQTYDILIRGGRVIDGSGNAWIKADVGIRNGRIAAVGRLDCVKAARVIDATGQVVTPGFIHMHTHSEYTLLYDGNGESKIRQGVTTEVVGERTSPGPIVGHGVEPAKEMLARWHIQLAWSDLNGYFARLLKSGTSINVASYVSEGQVRDDVMGPVNRPPTPAEMAEMKRLVAEEMQQGAFGLVDALEATGGYAQTPEIIDLAKVVHQYGGLYATHMRGEGDTVLDSIREAAQIGEQADVPVEIFHLKVAGKENWGRMPQVVALIDSERARGIDIRSSQYPYIAASHPTLPLLPPWALDGGVDKTMERLKDPKLRDRMKHDIMTGLPGWTQNYVLYSGGWSGIVIGGTRSQRNAWLAGKTLADLGKIRGKDPADAFFDLLIEEHGQVSCMPFMMNEKDVITLMQAPWVDICSDGSALTVGGLLGEGHPHPRNYGTFPRILGHYVREEHALTLEDAVRRMTSLAAERMGFTDRGLLRPGYWADVVVFNPDTVKDTATYANPEQYPVGINYVLVNGKIVIDQGKHTGARPGMALRGPGYPASTARKAGV